MWTEYLGFPSIVADFLLLGAYLWLPDLHQSMMLVASKNPNSPSFPDVDK
jgi:hypothetical protein